MRGRWPRAAVAPPTIALADAGQSQPSQLLPEVFRRGVGAGVAIRALAEAGTRHFQMPSAPE